MLRLPEGSGHSWSHRVLGGGGHQEENEAGTPNPRGEVGFSLLEARREGKRGCEEAAAHAGEGGDAFRG